MIGPGTARPLATDEVSNQDVEALREEVERLKSLLDEHGIDWKKPVESRDQATTPQPATPTPAGSESSLSTREKLALFRRLFRGRNDVYPLRWQSSKGKSGYSPACGNEWKPGICQKPKVKCADCTMRQLLPVTDQVIYDHLAGKHTLGVYPLLADDTCWFLAADFDKSEWREDAKAFVACCKDLDIPVALEISRSGKGAHVWLFFDRPVPARQARQLGAALISNTCSRRRQLSLASYDRLFPNQDTMPKGGFGNLIALPLQKVPRQEGNSVFVDEELVPFADQWQYLANLRPMPSTELQDTIMRASGGRHPLDVAFVLEDDTQDPWEKPKAQTDRIIAEMPESVAIVHANQIFIAKDDLPQPLANRLIRLAAFQNPEFYKAQAMRMPVWSKPRIIGCAENFPRHIGLPRGCVDDITDLLAANGIRVDVQDERCAGDPIQASFVGTLRQDQELAVQEMITHDIGVLCAPTAFGKTVTAAAIIAERKINTLILVHRTALLRQWDERLRAFLELPEGAMGYIGGGKKTPSGHIDIAVLQSLARSPDLADMAETYGQVIVDECHHLSAVSFERILKTLKAKHIVGLTATPIRRDGHHPIVFMQCGPIRHRAQTPESAPSELEVQLHDLPPLVVPPDAGIQDIFRQLANDEPRNRRIAEDVKGEYRNGRHVLILTERTDHLQRLQTALSETIGNLYVLHGRMSKSQRTAVMQELSDLDDRAPRVILATGRLIGEGFDHPSLDTLILAMPISWKGTLQQYAGRLHRQHGNKDVVRVHDYLDSENTQLGRMWAKRHRGYESMGYQIRCPDRPTPLQNDRSGDSRQPKFTEGPGFTR